MFTTKNEKTVTLKLQRRDVCKIILALDAVTQTAGTSTEYGEIRKMIQEQLSEHDAKQDLK